MKKKWFEKLLVESIFFAFFLYFIFFILNVVFIIYGNIYYDDIGNVEDFYEYWKTFVNSLRYDSSSIAIFTLGYFALGLVLFWTEFRWVILWLYVLAVLGLSIFVGMYEIVFFEIYGDVFNANLYGALFGNGKIFANPQIQKEYTIAPKVLIGIVLGILFIAIYSKIFFKIVRDYGYDPLSSIHSRSTRRESSIAAFILFVIFALMMVFSFHGGFSFKRVDFSQVIKPIDNQFLSKVSTGAFRNLYLIYKDHRKISNSHFSDYVSQTPLEATREYFHLDNQNTSYDLKKLLTKKVNNHSDVKIEHIFYIIVDGLSEYHFSEEYNEIGLTSGLKSLLEDSHGVKIGVFLENANTTMKNIDVYLTGLFQTELPIGSMLGKLESFATAPGIILKDLGYQNTFYYSGLGMWQNLEQYAHLQGFDEVYDSTHIVHNAKLNGYPLPYEGAWGAYDHHLFAFVRGNIFKERYRPTFNMILTSPHYPPYDIPLEQFNVPLEEIENLFKHTSYEKKDSRLIGSIWYQDKVITKFIQDLSKTMPNSLFVITGNHYDREFPKIDMSAKVSKTIPLIVYSPALDLKKRNNIGSHIDITPTIVEIVAPDGYAYPSFGRPLVSNEVIALVEKNVALGYFTIATDRFMYDKNGKLEYFKDGIARNNDEELASSLYKRLQQATALSWWILTHGYEVKDIE
ncbi:sulfatase-like hydrolase/transferase [Helicobacter sp. MIT 05-5293]|uniref:LTA synthase family protein n=1 Tax=Helicobacter sp. MIT 05-5293 TaxID=1548149 RepID=UPI000A4598AA|nr:sulfatase-like hydrolase/transferase [Helicobacter sp. MIT 05-5293]